MNETKNGPNVLYVGTGGSPLVLVVEKTRGGYVKHVNKGLTTNFSNKKKLWEFVKRNYENEWWSKYRLVWEDTQ